MPNEFGELTNEERADRARRALIAYAGPNEEYRVSSGDELDEVIRDLITDLGHLYQAEVADGDDAFSFEEAIERAVMMCDLEASDEDEDDDDIGGFCEDPEAFADRAVKS